MKKKLLFVITQFYKGGAEVALLNLLHALSPEEYEVDFLIFDQMVLPNAASLIPQIPEWVHVCHAAEKEGYFAVVTKICFKIFRKFTSRQLYRRSAWKFVKSKEYDVAFSYGEWMSPEFVARKVKAKKKMIWIHADIDKAPYVNEKILLGYDSSYNQYIFVSEHSRLSAEKKFPILKGKSVVIHNLCADKEIIQASKEEISGLSKYSKPWVLSVGNLREEKNYPRQIEVMRILKERGVPLTWFCIGSTANLLVYQQIKRMLEKYELEEQFVLLGVEQNPYKYMRQADAVMVLSDYEAWSLVITEAKLLGIPVIATATSGAKEQIEDGKTGILTGFEAELIADVIQEYIENKELQETIKKNLIGFSTYQEVLGEFSRALDI